MEERTVSVIMDLEAVAIDNVEQFVEPVEAAKNLKDPDKIAADVERKQREQVDRAALFPWTCRVVCLGWINDEGHERIVTCRDERAEADALQQFWADCVFRDDGRFIRPIITFCGRTYDLPVVLARSMLLGVPAPALNMDRYRSPNIDLADRLTWHGAIQLRSLKFFARRFGIPVEDTISGADIAGLVAADQWTDVAAHCLSDVRLTRALAERMGIVRGMKAVA